MKEVERVVRIYEEFIQEHAIGLCEIIGWEGKVSHDTNIRMARVKRKVDKIRQRYYGNKG